MAMRVLTWAFSTEVGAVISIGLLAVLYPLLRLTAVACGFDIVRYIQVVLAILILGVFLGVIVVTEEAKTYRNSGGRIRFICGAIAGAAIIVIFHGPIEAVILASLMGGVMGYLGKYWANVI